MNIEDYLRGVENYPRLMNLDDLTDEPDEGDSDPAPDGEDHG